MNRRLLSPILATIALVFGWAGLAFTLFGPAYTTASSSAVSVDAGGSVIGPTTSSTVTGMTSLFASGVSPITVFFLSTMALLYLVVLGGAVLAYRGRHEGWILMVIAVVPLVVLNLISFGLALTMPATLFALFALVETRIAGGVPPGHGPPVAPPHSE
jgi:hypothetical protein